MVKAAKELQQSSTRSIYLSKWLEVDGFLLFHSKIYVPNVPNVHDLYQHIISLHHNTKVAGHTGH